MKSQCQIRKDAAEILKTRGWCQGSFGTPDGPRCLLGACREAAGYYAYAAYAARAADAAHATTSANAAAYAADAAACDAVSWNDAPGRTAEEVIAALLSGCE